MPEFGRHLNHDLAAYNSQSWTEKLTVARQFLAYYLCLLYTLWLQTIALGEICEHDS